MEIDVFTLFPEAFEWFESQRHVRNAWSYESPQPKMEPVRDRFGFWEDVVVR